MLKPAILTSLLAASSLALLAYPAGEQTTVSGWVIDSACAYTKGLQKPISPGCAKACAHNGSPLVILRNDGTIFLPISDQVPATAQNEKLMPFAGQRVTVKGREFLRSGSHALVIDSIAPEGKTNGT